MVRLKADTTYEYFRVALFQAAGLGTNVSSGTVPSWLNDEEHGRCVCLGALGVLLRNTKLNAEAAEKAAEKNHSEALPSLRALRSNVVISFHGVCPAHDDSVVDSENAD